ncbi:fungal-specific transcription factor [Xylariales sp. AK1849]|nr:fungal-specific transcription factor [Xylariales sp. AK1849]
MGILSRTDIRRPYTTPDTPPPELESPSTSAFNCKIPEDRSWKATVPISPPMSNYDQSTKAAMPAGKKSEDSQTRRDVAHHAPRQQLPSLSSIFGPPNQMRALHSPLSDRPSPLRSPLDRPSSACANSERSYSNSYFPNVSTPVTQPRSVYEPRLEQEMVPLPPVAPRFPGPLSPRTREFSHIHTGPQSDSASSVRWPSQSSHPESMRPEYVFGTRESASSFRQVNDRLPYALPGHKSSLEALSSYREQGQLPPLVPIQSPSSVGPGISEAAPVKDGLGPKIWTGTHFLPRFVRQAEVSGEGVCYFYDDGTHCKTTIDGEQVNAHWGVTKAGKPRKRLAIACLTCREKKIKCDPDFPRCVQCEKFGRVCKFKNAPRGGHNTSPATSPGALEEPRKLGSHSRPVEPRLRSASSASVSPGTTALSHPSPELPGMPAKRMRVGYEDYKPPSHEAVRFYQPPEGKKATLSWHQRDLPRVHEDLLYRAWQTDPYVSDPSATSTIITSFFNHIETTALRFLPVRVFHGWVRNNAYTRSTEDRMLLYSILALGLHVSGGPKHLAFEYAQVARFACERSAPGLQLVQSKLILSIFYLANGRDFDSYETLSGAISTGLCLQYNLELDQTADSELTRFPYAMRRDTFAESRRRTLFACFILERLNGLFPSRPTLLKAKDISLRLPHDEVAFDSNMEGLPETPMFDVSREIPSFGESVGIMGCLVHAVEIWGRVLGQIQRESMGSGPLQSDSRTLEKVTERLRQFQDAIPPRFSFSDPNLAKASADGVDASLATLHLVFLLAKTKFSRHSQAAVARPLQAEAIVQESKSLATDLMYASSTLRDQLIARGGTGSPFLPATFAVYAAVEAIDIMTATGMVSSIESMLRETRIARDLCESLSWTWASAKTQKTVLDRRMEKLGLIRERAANATRDPIPGCEISGPMKATDTANLMMYRILEPLETRFPLRFDVIYTLQPSTRVP